MSDNQNPGTIVSREHRGHGIVVIHVDADASTVTEKHSLSLAKAEIKMLAAEELKISGRVMTGTHVSGGASCTPGRTEWRWIFNMTEK